MTAPHDLAFGRRSDGDFDRTLSQLVAELPPGAVVAELGAGAKPVLGREPRILQGQIEYYRVDISAEELEKGSGAGISVVADLASPDFSLPVPVDLAFSKMVAEHVTDGRQFLSNVYRSLAPGGVYLQVSPVLYTLPFSLNRVFPEDLSARLLRIVRPSSKRRGKFPARYSWCRGPTPRHLERLRELGFEVVVARGYFGHNYYRRLPPLQAAEEWKSRWLIAHPQPTLCSFALYVLRRPSAADGDGAPPDETQMTQVQPGVAAGTPRPARQS